MCRGGTVPHAVRIRLHALGKLTEPVDVPRAFIVTRTAINTTLRSHAELTMRIVQFVPIFPTSGRTGLAEGSCH